jgi:hypothetical protein
LLAADAAFLAQGDGDAFLRQEQGGADADDAAADDHHIGSIRQRRVGGDRLDGRGHAVPWCVTVR